MLYGWLLVVFFFFQAEDGIRDYKVTGVQTCALPISGPAVFPAVAAGFVAVAVAAGVDEVGDSLGLAVILLRERVAREPRGPGRAQRDRKSGVEGKRVDLRGRRIIKKKKKKNKKK